MTIYEKLQKIQEELKAPKSNYNDFGGFAYRSAEDMYSAIKPILSKYKVLMYISDDIVEEVRSRNDIVDVISSYVKLEKKGGSYFGLCPFHNEKSGY